MSDYNLVQFFDLNLSYKYRYKKEKNNLKKYQLNTV